MKRDPETQRMLALIESIRTLDPDLHTRLTTEGMRSDAEALKDAVGKS